MTAESRSCHRCDGQYVSGTYRIHKTAHTVVYRKPRPRLDPKYAERRRAVVASWQSGKRAIDVAQEFGISRERVRQLLKLAGIDSSRHPRPLPKCGICGTRYRPPYLVHARAALHSIRNGNLGVADRTRAMAEAYAAGENVPEIAARFGVSKVSVYRAGRIVFGPLRYQGGRVGVRKPAQKAAVTMLRNGDPIWLIAEATGLEASVIGQLRLRYQPKDQLPKETP